MGKKVSILIPTYNRASLLQKCIESALMQDYDNLEIVIADNASTDDTAQMIATQFNDPRIVYFHNQQNIGLVPNFNKLLIEYATGDYVLFLPDDDRLVMPGYVSTAMHLMGQQHDIVFSCGGIRTRNLMNGSIIRESLIQGDSQVITVNGVDYWRNYGKIDVTFITMLFPRILAITLGGFSPGIAGIDTLLTLKLCFHGKFIYINQAIAEIGHHANRHSYVVTMSDLYTAFRNMDRIRLVVTYAEERGISQNEIHTWKRVQMVAAYMFIIKGTCLRQGTNSDKSEMLYQLSLLAKEAGESDYYIEGLIQTFFPKETR